MAALSILALCWVFGSPQQSAEPRPLKEGVHLLLDEFWIERAEGVRRSVCSPDRDSITSSPVVMGREDGCFQPYVTVLRDAGRFRIWYGAATRDRNMDASHIGYMESADGVRWQRPHRVLRDPAPIQFGTCVLDEGPSFPDPAKRYKFCWWKDGGLKVAASPDGLTWTPLSPNVVLRHNHDINSIYRDPLRGTYVATVSVHGRGKTWNGNRRTTFQATSRDLLSWSELFPVLWPEDGVDEGETQFYAMDGFLVRGDLVIGMVKVLRDDLHADDPPDPPKAYGIGYTALAWTRDGRTWTRDRAKFFDRNPAPGTWDHAHAWIDEQLPVGKEVYLYYAGYARGHKVNRFEERQIGVVKIRRDRYVAREAGANGGFLRTPPVKLEADALRLNADASKGEIRVQVLDPDGRPVPGFDRDDCAPLRGDALDAPVSWKKPLAELRGRTVRLEFILKNARLFAFEAVPAK